MWTQDWLRRFRSGKIVSVELTGRNDAAIAHRQSTLANLEDADSDQGDVVVLDDQETDFVLVHADRCKQPSNATNASHIEDCSVKARPRNNPQQLVQGCEKVLISRASAHAMNLCGRGDHNHTFEDLRSASQAIKRDKTTRRKYYNFKHVKPGEFEDPRCESVDLFGNSSETQAECSQSIITKSELYRQAQLPPRPPMYHRRHIDKIRGTISHRVDNRRAARKHGKAIMKDYLKDL